MVSMLGDVTGALMGQYPCEAVVSLLNPKTMPKHGFSSGKHTGTVVSGETQNAPQLLTDLGLTSDLERQPPVMHY